MPDLIDTPELRAKRLTAYRAGQYTMPAPPVYSGNWDEQAWMNWVRFDDRTISGFLPYYKTTFERRRSMVPA